MYPIPLINQILYQNTYLKLSVLCGKVFDNLLSAGRAAYVKTLIEGLNRTFSLGTIVHGPGLLRFLGLNLFQSDDY